MRVLMLDAPKEMLDERRRLGQDGRDEMWEGLAQARGLVPHYETGLFDDEANYRVPDLLFCLPEHLSERGAEGAELVVDLRSPDDESYAKLDFYAAKGVREVLVLHSKDRRFELFRFVDGRTTLMSTDASGAVDSHVLGIRSATVADKLRITWAEGATDI